MLPAEPEYIVMALILGIVVGRRLYWRWKDGPSR